MVKFNIYSHFFFLHRAEEKHIYQGNSKLCFPLSMAENILLWWLMAVTNVILGG